MTGPDPPSKPPSTCRRSRRRVPVRCPAPGGIAPAVHLVLATRTIVCFCLSCVREHACTRLTGQGNTRAHSRTLAHPHPHARTHTLARTHAHARVCAQIRTHAHKSALMGAYTHTQKGQMHVSMLAGCGVLMLGGLMLRHGPIETRPRSSGFP